MTFKAIPIDMLSAPNYYAPYEDGFWTITSPNAQVLWFALDIIDALGQRPFVLGSSAVMTLVFQRADMIATNPQGNLVNTVQSVTKLATAQTANRSIFSVAMTALDIKTALSGTVKFNFVDGSANETFVMNWILKKKLTDPGC